MIDGHCHLNKKIGDCAEAIHNLYITATAAGVKGIILLNLPELEFNNNQVIENVKKYDGFFFVFPSINPANTKAYENLIKLKALGASGLKLHPRLHGYRLHNKECIQLMRASGELGMPVIIDCFPDGKNLSLGNTPEAFARLAEKIPETRIAIGHAGGHKILDALMVAKYFKNIYLDLSYTLLYYRDSPVREQIAYAIKSIKAKRVFWGSDYPERNYEGALNLSLKEFGRMNLSEEAQESILEKNAKIFLGECS